MCVCSACVCFFCIILYVNSVGRTELHMGVEYHIQVNIYHVSTRGIDERMINVHYYYQKPATVVRGSFAWKFEQAISW